MVFTVNHFLKTMKSAKNTNAKGCLKNIVNGVPAIPLNIVLNNLKPPSKQPAQPVFLAEPLIPTADPSSLPWERVRERATNRKVCIGAVRVLGKVAAIRGMPSPQSSPTGEGADVSFAVAGSLKSNLDLQPLMQVV